MRPNNIMETEGLCRDFDEERVVDDVSFYVPEGSVTGLIGPNGAGKTTLIKMLLGQLRPTQGVSRIFGESSMAMARGTRKRIGYLSEESLPFESMTPNQAFRYVSAFFDDWDWKRSQELVDRLEVPVNQLMDSMSMGQRRRAELALVLAQNPDLLILDDPAVGLDASVRREFLWAALETARQEGKSVLFTSHILHDVERAVDRIGVLMKGRLIEFAELDELKQRTKRLVFEHDLARLPATVPGQISKEEESGTVSFVTNQFSEDWFGTYEEPCRGTVEALNLEEIFVSFTRSGD